MAQTHIKYLTTLHKDAALLYAQGYTHEEVAQHFQVDVQAVHRWARSPLFQEQLEVYRRDIRAEALSYAAQKMGMLQAKAVDKLESLMQTANSEAVQLGATREILERGPLRIQRGSESQKVTTGAIVLGKDMLMAMAQVAEMTGDQVLLESMQGNPLFQAQEQSEDCEEAEDPQDPEESEESADPSLSESASDASLV